MRTLVNAKTRSPWVPNRDREKPHGSPLPHHRTNGSRIRRFGRLSRCTKHTALHANRSVISNRANVGFIPATELALCGLAGCNTAVPWQATSPLFQSPLGVPFGPSDQSSWLLAFTAPTMPSADFSTVFSTRYQMPSFDSPKHRRDLPG